MKKIPLLLTSILLAGCAAGHGGSILPAYYFNVRLDKEYPVNDTLDFQIQFYAADISINDTETIVLEAYAYTSTQFCSGSEIHQMFLKLEGKYSLHRLEITKDNKELTCFVNQSSSNPEPRDDQFVYDVSIPFSYLEKDDSNEGYMYIGFISKYYTGEDETGSESNHEPEQYRYKISNERLELTKLDSYGKVVEL